MGEVNETKVLTQEKSITLTEKDKRKKVSAPKNQMPIMNDDNTKIIGYIMGVSENDECDGHLIKVDIDISGLTQQQIIFHTIKSMVITCAPALRLSFSVKVIDFSCVNTFVSFTSPITFIP